MTITLAIKDMFGLLSLFAAVFYIVQVVAFDRFQSKSKIYLVVYLSLLAFIMLFFEAYDLGFKSFSTKLIPFLNAVVLALAPAIWVYISALTNNKIKVFNQFLPSIIVAVVSFILTIVLFKTNDQTLKSQLGELYTYLTLGSLSVVFLIQSTIYTLKSIKQLNKYEKSIAESYSYTEEITLKWAKVLVYGFVVFMIAQIAINVFDKKESDVMFDLIMFGYIIHIGFNGLKQNDKLLVQVPEQETPEQPEIETSGSNKDLENISDTKAETLARVKADLLTCMKEKKPFLNQELNIYQLSSDLGTNSKYLSQVINTEFNESFITYMNKHRVEEAKILLKSEEVNQITIEAIGQKVGFKSKSSFNTAFKKIVGTTPSQYKKA